MQKDLKIQKIFAQSNTRSESLANLFSLYENRFTPNEMKSLRSIGKGERNDSTFVSKCVQFLHGGPNNVANRVATSSHVEGKKPLSPDKVEIVSNMLSERLAAENISNEAVIAREIRFNKLLNSAVTTARKTVANQRKVPTASIQAVNEPIENPIVPQTQPTVNMQTPELPVNFLPHPTQYIFLQTIPFLNQQN